MEKLKDIIDHSDWLVNERISIVEKWLLHRNRVAFGKQPLNISMFVPAKFVDGEWVVLEIPIDIYYRPDYGCQKFPQECYEHDLKEYETAKSNVYFEGFVLIREHENYWIFMKDLYDYKFSKNKTIEDLVKYEPTLTTTAKKQIGL